jgi:peptidoglycan/LPS O-acetylase OafA/YrhL
MIGSTSLYITHHPMVRLVKNAVAMLHLHLDVTLTIAACLAGSVVAAQLFLVVWDRPIRKWLSGRLLPDRLLPASSGPLAPVSVKSGAD